MQYSKKEPAGIFIVVRPVSVPKQLASTVQREGSNALNSIVVRSGLITKISGPNVRSVPVYSIVILVRSAQFAKDHSPIVSTLSGSTTDVKPVSANDPLPISSKEVASVKSSVVNRPHFWKA